MRFINGKSLNVVYIAGKFYILFKIFSLCTNQSHLFQLKQIGTKKILFVREKMAGSFVGD